MMSQTWLILIGSVLANPLYFLNQGLAQGRRKEKLFVGGRESRQDGE